MWSIGFFFLIILSFVSTMIETLFDNYNTTHASKGFTNFVCTIFKLKVWLFTNYIYFVCISLFREYPAQNWFSQIPGPLVLPENKGVRPTIRRSKVIMK
jgi:hypothetical protein